MYLVIWGPKDCGGFAVKNIQLEPCKPSQTNPIEISRQDWSKLFGATKCSTSAKEVSVTVSAYLHPVELHIPYTMISGNP